MSVKVVALAVPLYLADAGGVLEQAAQQFLTQGVLGSLCIILMIALYKKDAALQSSFAARVDDAKKFGEILAEHSKATAVNTEALAGLASLIRVNQNTGRVRA